MENEWLIKAMDVSSPPFLKPKSGQTASVFRFKLFTHFTDKKRSLSRTMSIESRFLQTDILRLANPY